jgi:hypothetical protein
MRRELILKLMKREKNSEFSLQVTEFQKIAKFMSGGLSGLTVFAESCFKRLI